MSANWLVQVCQLFRLFLGGESEVGCGTAKKTVLKAPGKEREKKRCTQNSLLVPRHGQQAEPYAHNEPLNMLCRSPYINWDQGFPSCLTSSLRREDRDICGRSQWAIKARHDGSYIRSAADKKAKLQRTIKVKLKLHFLQSCKELGQGLWERVAQLINIFISELP